MAEKAMQYNGATLWSNLPLEWRKFSFSKFKK